MSLPESSPLVPVKCNDGVPAVRYVIDDCGVRVPATEDATDGDYISSSTTNCREFLVNNAPDLTDGTNLKASSQCTEQNNTADEERKAATNEELRTPKSALQQPRGGSISGSSGGANKSSGVQIKDPPLTETRSYYVNADEGSTKWAAGGGAENHGPLHSAIPIMPLALAITCCVLNILLPGSGTMISAFSVFCRATSTRLRSPIHAFAINLVVGILQLATFIVIVGWIWSILWGMTFIQLALSADRSQARRGGGGSVSGGGQVSYYVRRHSSVVV